MSVSTSVDTGKLPAEIDECWQPVHPVLLGVPRVIHLGQYRREYTSTVQLVLYSLGGEMRRLREGGGGG
jgi:hypothetical protein